MNRTTIDVARIIASQNIAIYFHPLVNLRARSVIGVEALVRATDPATGSAIPPEALFRAAGEAGAGLEVDRLCRITAMQAFMESGLPDGTLLFVNINASILNAMSVGSNSFADAVRQTGLDASRVAIEIVESHVADDRHLVDFARFYRDMGFIVVIDDFGTEHSNFKRLIDIKPDVIKIDRGIIAGIRTDHYRQSILRSIVELSRRIGALSLVEGVETAEELAQCHLLGVELCQGFFFGEPSPRPREVMAGARRSIEAGVHLLEKAAARDRAETLRIRRRFRAVAAEAAAEVLGGLRAAGIPGAERVFDGCIGRYPDIGCMYMIDPRGIQVTATHCSTRPGYGRRHALFRPAPAGTDHSLKSYYRGMKGRAEYITDSYVSFATGNLCTTLAVRMQPDPSHELILCIDFE